MDINKIVKRAVDEIQNGQVLNLGIGLPTRIIEHLPEGLDVFFHSENGILGTKLRGPNEDADRELIDAGGNYVTTRMGASFFDSSVSFAMIRRGKIDISIMGAFEVDELGNLANWKIPGYYSPGIGGAMELAQKTPKLIIMCTHNDKNGNSKILKKCKLPLTASNCVSRIITDKAVMDITDEGLMVKEIAIGLSQQELINQTEATLIIPDNVGSF